MSKLKLVLGTAALAVLLLPAAQADDRNGRRLEVRLKGFQEVPAVSSAASGRFKATVDATHTTISYELSYAGLEGDVRMAHIHIGQHGVNGGIMVWLCQTATFFDVTAPAPTCPQSGTVSGTITAQSVIGPAAQGISAAEFDAFLGAVRAGVAYVNVHTARFPGGEIRGQLRDDD